MGGTGLRNVGQMSIEDMLLMSSSDFVYLHSLMPIHVCSPPMFPISKGISKTGSQTDKSNSTKQNWKSLVSRQLKNLYTLTSKSWH